MNRYKIHIRKPQPTKEEMDKYKDFDSLIDDYGKLHRPWYLMRDFYKDPKAIRLLILVMIVLLAMYFSHVALKEEKSKTPPDQEMPSQETTGVQIDQSDTPHPL